MELSGSKSVSRKTSVKQWITAIKTGTQPHWSSGSCTSKPHRDLALRLLTIIKKTKHNKCWWRCAGFEGGMESTVRYAPDKDYQDCRMDWTYWTNQGYPSSFFFFLRSSTIILQILDHGLSASHRVWNATNTCSCSSLGWPPVSVRQSRMSCRCCTRVHAGSLQTGSVAMLRITGRPGPWTETLGHGWRNGRLSETRRLSSRGF